MVSASADPGLYEAGAPVALLPHGATYNRILKGLSGAAGTAREHLVGPDGELPAFMAMPGWAAMDRLAEDCPEALPSAEITGDLCMERMRVSTVMREAYREALGVRRGQRLVAVSSTWGPYSLTATDRSLPEHLLTGLAADEFKVAYIPHPNIDADHGGGLDAYLRPLLRAGLVMVPPEEGWRALLIAADCVVGDHGTTTFTAANLGIPVLLGAFGFEETTTEAPQAEFGRATPVFERDAEPAGQIDRAIATAPRERAAYLRAAWEEPATGTASLLLPRLYRLMSLDSPAVPYLELLPTPVPLPASEAMRAWHCEARIEDSRVHIDRYPAVRPQRPSGHLVATDSCRNEQLRREARVFLAHRRDWGGGEADAVAQELFTAYLGCTVVSVRTGPGSASAFVDDGDRFDIECDPALLDLAPSMLYAALRLGRRGSVRFETDGSARPVVIRRIS